MTAFGLHGSLLATAVITVILLLTLVDSSALGIEQKWTSGVQKRPTIRRRRRSVVDIQRELGGYARRALERVFFTVSANQKAPAGKKSNFESLVRISVTDAAPSRPCIRDRDSN